jgi:hypothetical protein
MTTAVMPLPTPLLALLLALPALDPPDFPWLAPPELLVVIGLGGGAAAADAAALAAAGADAGWPCAFCTRLRKCDPPALAGGGAGGGGGSTGRAMAGNAVIMVLSSAVLSASRVPAKNLT